MRRAAAKKVLVVEDNELNRRMIATRLRDFGLRVDDDTEAEGLDTAEHAETAYHQAGLAMGSRG